MKTLTITSTSVSLLVVGDPGVLTISVPPKQTKTVDVTEAQELHLLPGLEKLKSVGWITFKISDAAEKAVTVSEEVKVTATPAAPPPPEPTPEPVADEPSEEEPVLTKEEEEEEKKESPPPAASPSSPKQGFFEKKNRNR